MYSTQLTAHKEILQKVTERELLNQGTEILLHMISMGGEQDRQ
jgi:hypothetical protein